MAAVVVRAAVEVTDRRDVLRAVAAQLPVDRREAVGLARAQHVGRLVAGPRLRLEMVDDDVEVLVPAANGEHRSVAGEQAVVALRRVRVPGVAIVDVALDAHDRTARRGEQADVDAALVVAVDEHHVAIAVGQHRLVEAHERRPILRLDDGEHTGLEVLDDAGGHPDRHLVDRLDDELEPADPVGPPGGDDLDARRLPFDHEIAAVLAQHRQLRGLVGLADQPVIAARAGDHRQRLEVLEHLVLVDLAVEAPLGGAVEALEGSELGPPLLPGGRVEHLGAGEQVLDVE